MDLTRGISQHWHGGQLLGFSGLDGATDYQHGLVGRTAYGSPGIDLKIPGGCSIRFGDAGSDFLVLGDALQVTGGPSRIRAAFVDAWHLLIEGPAEVVGQSEAIEAIRSGDRLLVGARETFDPQLLQADLNELWMERTAWLQRQPIDCGDDPVRNRCVIHALALMKGQVLAPEGSIHRRWTTPDRWPHRGMWLWDSAFHAIGWRHLDIALAREILTAVFDHQQPDGFVPHFMTPYEASTITQPPVLALAAKVLHDTEPDLGWIESVYPKLSAYIQWDLDNRDTDGDGLVEWFIEGDPRCRSGESGMDNSTRFDSARQLGATDFNAFLASECEILAGFAELLNRPADQKRWAEQADRLRERINTLLYSPEAGFYLDYDAGAGRQSPVLASSGFLPLLCGAPNGNQVQRLLDHLKNPRTFGSPVPIPSIAVSHPEHSTDMWRGPMWVCINALVAQGLERYGRHDEALDLRQRTMAEIERRFDEYGVFFEYYDDLGQTPPPRLARKGKVAPPDQPEPFPHQVVHDFGWTATLYLDMVARVSAAQPAAAEIVSAR